MIDCASQAGAHSKLTSAGVGKTFLSAASVKHLRKHALFERRGQVVTYAFLQASEPVTAKVIIAGLLGQILEYEHRNVSHPTHSGTYNSNLDYQPNPVSEALSLVLSSRRDSAGGSLSYDELSSLFCDIAQLFHRVFVVLDGLDEAQDSVQEALLATLTPHPSINLLITSRPLIDSLVNHHTPNALTVDIRSLNDEDIKLCLRHRIEKSPNLRAILSGTSSTPSVERAPSLSSPEQLVEKITVLSEGRYIGWHQLAWSRVTDDMLPTSSQLSYRRPNDFRCFAQSSRHRHGDAERHFEVFAWCHQQIRCHAAANPELRA